MFLAQIRLLLALVLLAGGFIICASARAQTSEQFNKFSVTLTFADLPPTIILCRDPAAIQQVGVDNAWQLFIDVDHNVNTGDTSMGFGAEVALQVVTRPQTYPCTPSSPVNTQQNLAVGIFVWDSTQFVDSGATATLAIDSIAGTMTITADAASVLGGLSSQSAINVVTFAAYTPSGSTPTIASDSAGPTFPNTSLLDGVGDVSGCSSPCTQSASWIQMTDLTRITTELSVDQPVFGGNTVYVEFDVAHLPASLDLCRYSASFANGAGSDSTWIAGFDLDGDSSTGDPGTDGTGDEARVRIVSAQQAQGCAPPITMPTGRALSAVLEQYDGSSHAYQHVADLPFIADPLTGKMIAQVNRGLPALNGLSAASTLQEITEGLYPNAGPLPYAADISAQFALGASFTDSSHDLVLCSSPCSTSVSWYAQLDLVGGGVILAPNEIFKGTFE